MKTIPSAKLALLSDELATHSAAIARRVDSWATLLNDTADPATVAGWRSLERVCHLIGHGQTAGSKIMPPNSTPSTVNANESRGTANSGSPRRIPRRPRPDGEATV